jgi:peptidoglycan/xylan/chitin deacetylase (PgdA/CDA1 family)
LGYIQILRQAAAEGHEVAQHGLEHDRFEFGIPPQMILGMPHEWAARERLAKERDAIEAGLALGVLRERLLRGRRILQDALEIPVVGFRAPCLSTCDNLYHALEAEDYLYDSSRHLQEAGWDILNDQRPIEPRPITRLVFDNLQYAGKLRSWPLTTEYTWYLSKKNFDITLDLAQHDALACMEAHIPFVTLSHVSPIQEGENGCGFEFYRRLLGFIRERAAQCGEELIAPTLAELTAQTHESRGGVETNGGVP